MDLNKENYSPIPWILMRLIYMTYIKPIWQYACTYIKYNHFKTESTESTTYVVHNSHRHKDIVRYKLYTFHILVTIQQLHFTRTLSSILIHNACRTSADNIDDSKENATQTSSHYTRETVTGHTSRMRDTGFSLICHNNCTFYIITLTLICL